MVELAKPRSSVVTSMAGPANCLPPPPPTPSVFSIPSLLRPAETLTPREFSPPLDLILKLRLLSGKSLILVDEEDDEEHKPARENEAELACESNGSSIAASLSYLEN